MKQCRTCRWWKDADFSAVRQYHTAASSETGFDMYPLGYCECTSAGFLPDAGWKGLTDEGYSCNEHEEKIDDS